MKINKIRLKFQFCTQIEIKMTYLVFDVLLFNVSSPLELSGRRLSTFKILSCTFFFSVPYNSKS